VVRFQKEFEKYKTYIEVRNANGNWVKDDVEESDESGNPERKDQENDQPDDEPKCFSHFLTETERSDK
jgi:hypothetical protein